MRKLYNEFFYVPKYGKGKIREKVMLMRTVMTVVVMTVCLAAMGLTAYAYFTYNVISASNVIRAANFETKVSIQISNSNNEPVTIERTDGKTQAATLHAGKEYLVTIEKAGTAQTGFCVISAAGCNIEKYHTQQLGKDVKSNTEGKDVITFKLMVTDTTVVSFSARWGTSSHYADNEGAGENDTMYIIDGETVTMQINGIADPTGSTEKEEAEKETTPVNTTTPPETTAPEATTPPQTSEPTQEPGSAEATPPTTPSEPAQSTSSTQPQFANEITNGSTTGADS